MLYKHNESHRHKTEKSRYKVTNRHEYNNGLRRQGDITIWFTETAISAWRPAMTGVRGRPQEYSDIAIETASFVRQVLYLPLRQTEGFMNSLARIMKVDITIPDFSSTSKRSIALPRHILTKATEPGSLVIVDATGLKVYSKDELHQKKHGAPARRTWRKLHLAVDENHQLLARELTIPQYGLRNYVELAVQRYKRIFGNTMKARAHPQQKTEAWISASVLNRMANIGMPVSIKP